MIGRTITWIYDHSWWLAPAWLLTILYLSISPLQSAPNIEIPGIDKLVHTGMYLWMTIFGYSAIQRQKFWTRVKLYSWPFAIGFSVIYGGVLELVQQYFTRFRQGDWVDFAANTAGCIFAWILHHYWVKPGRIARTRL